MSAGKTFSRRKESLEPNTAAFEAQWGIDDGGPNAVAIVDRCAQALVFWNVKWRLLSRVTVAWHLSIRRKSLHHRLMSISGRGLSGEFFHELESEEVELLAGPLNESNRRQSIIQNNITGHIPDTLSSCPCFILIVGMLSLVMARLSNLSISLNYVSAFQFEVWKRQNPSIRLCLVSRSVVGVTSVRLWSELFLDRLWPGWSYLSNYFLCQSNRSRRENFFHKSHGLLTVISI